MFRNEAQRVAVCNTFLTHFYKAPLFSESGPSPVAIEYAEHGCPWSSKEAAFFRLAWRLWTGEFEKSPAILYLLHGLDNRSLELLAGFILALRSEDGLDAWVREHSHLRAV